MDGAVLMNAEEAEAFKKLANLIATTDDTDGLRRLAMELAQEVVTTRIEERRLWAIIHAMQAENIKLHADDLLH